MITTAVRLYGKNDLRIEEFELPEPSVGELLLSVKANAICSSDINTLYSVECTRFLLCPPSKPQYSKAERFPTNHEAFVFICLVGLM